MLLIKSRTGFIFQPLIAPIYGEEPAPYIRCCGAWTSKGMIHIAQSETLNPARYEGAAIRTRYICFSTQSATCMKLHTCHEVFAYFIM